MGRRRDAKRMNARPKIAPPIDKTPPQWPRERDNPLVVGLGHWAVLRRLHRFAPRPLPPPPPPSSASPVASSSETVTPESNGTLPGSVQPPYRRCRPWRRSERWCALADNDLVSAAFAAFGNPPWQRHATMVLLRRALAAVMGPVANPADVWPTFYTVIGGTPSNRRPVGALNACESKAVGPLPPEHTVTGPVHADTVVALRGYRLSGAGSQWQFDKSGRYATDRDPDACRIWALRRSNLTGQLIFLSVTITTDDRGHPWNGDWPLPHGASAGVFVRMYPRSFLVERPHDVGHLIEYATDRINEQHIIDQYSLFFDDGDDIVVFRDVGGFEN
jgi:hypothetical protein